MQGGFKMNPVFLKYQMKRKAFFSCMALMFSLLANAQVQDPAYDLLLKQLLSHSVREISVQEAVAKPTGILFLDAREEREYEVSHIKSAIPVGYDDFTLATVKDIPKNQRIIVYCSVGYRSEKVAEKLQAAGYTNVVNLYGGIFEWVNEGHEVVGPSGHPTTKVHAYNAAWGVWLKNGEKVY